jgi:hypothetical protein
VLVVDGNLTINGSCEGGFSGLIYVRGRYVQLGGTINGAVVAEGRSELANEATLRYDPRALLEASLLVAPAEFWLSQGTWRQR